MVNSNMISKASMSHEEEKMLFSSLVASELHPQMPQGETRVHRRRKRAKGGGAEGDPKKRRLSDEQVKLLEISFGEERKLELGRKVHLAAELGLDPKQVAVWFQNRRARHKSKKVEEAYLELKSIHDATVVEKCHLENEVLKLKDKLFEAQEEVRKLSLGVNGAAGGGSNSTGEVTGSPRSSTLTYQPLVAEFGLAEEDAELMYIQEHDLSDYMIEWAYFYDM